MRSIVVALAAAGAFAALGGHPAHAQLGSDYLWCSFNPYQDITSCGFSTFTQCQASISGMGGYCLQNPRSTYDYAPPQRPRGYRSPERE